MHRATVKHPLLGVLHVCTYSVQVWDDALSYVSEVLLHVYNQECWGSEAWVPAAQHVLQTGRKKGTLI